MRVTWPLVLLLFFLTASGTLAEDAPVRIPGTQIALPLPEGFEVAERFPGIGREADSASVMVAEVPAPFDLLVEGLTDAALAGQGMEVVERRAARIDGREALWIAATQQAGGQTFRKWMAVFGAHEQTILLTATVPDANAGALGTVLQAVLQNARWDLSAPVNPFEALGFRVSETAGLKLVHALPTGLVFLPPGVEIGTPGEHLMLAAARSFREVEIDDVEDFARQRLSQVEQYSELRDLKGRAVRHGGFEGYELVGTGVEGDAEVAVYQALLLDEEDYFIFVGSAPPSQSQSALEEMRAVVASVRREPPVYELSLRCNRDRLLLGQEAGCSLAIQGWAPEGLPDTNTPGSSGVAVAQSLIGQRPEGFVYSFQHRPAEPGDTVLGPLQLTFQGQELTSNTVELRVLELPEIEGPITVLAFPREVQVGEVFDIVVVEKGVETGGLKAVSSVRVGGKPVLGHRSATPVAKLVGNDDLAVEAGTSTTTRKNDEPAERITFYKATARRPGSLRIDRALFPSLDDGAELKGVTVEVRPAGDD